MNLSTLIAHINQKASYLCVGLDTDIEKLPAHLKNDKNAVVKFNRAIIEATKDHCVCYKINTAFYESRGRKGWEDLEETLALVPKTHFTIADAKRGDIGNTSSHYAKAFFESLDFDAVTVAPYMGEDSVRPFLEYENKFTIVLGLTSNKGAEDFELLKLDKGPRLYEEVIRKIASWGSPQNLMFVTGATQATELINIRTIIPDNFLLVPGVGFQGGSLADVTMHGRNKDVGLLVNVSRAIIFASKGEDYAEEARVIAGQYHEEMKRLLG